MVGSEEVGLSIRPMLPHERDCERYGSAAVAAAFWSDKAAWPQRYAVRLLIGEDLRTSEHIVTTWRGRDKAIALAVAMHVRRHGGHVGVHDVQTEEVGPAPQAPDGRPEPIAGDLVDHLEFRS